MSKANESDLVVEVERLRVQLSRAQTEVERLRAFRTHIEEAFGRIAHELNECQAEVERLQRACRMALTEIEPSGGWAVHWDEAHEKDDCDCVICVLRAVINPSSPRETT